MASGKLCLGHVPSQPSLDIGNSMRNAELGYLATVAARVVQLAGDFAYLSVFSPHQPTLAIWRHYQFHTRAISTVSSYLGSQTGCWCLYMHGHREVARYGIVLHAEAQGSCRDQLGCPKLSSVLESRQLDTAAADFPIAGHETRVQACRPAGVQTDTTYNLGQMTRSGPAALSLDCRARGQTGLGGTGRSLYAER